MIAVVDIETNGLRKANTEKKTGIFNPAITKIHCLSYENKITGEIKTLVKYEEMREFLLTPGLIIVGHNIFRFDIPVLEDILQIKITCKLIDTLALSFYLFPEREKHGLGPWGVDLGISKPKVEDWKNQPIEVYIFRCEEDVKINSCLYDLMIEKLHSIYESELDINRLIEYLGFKMDCAREQEENPIRLDIDLINQSIKELENLQKEKFEALGKAMPPKINYAKAEKPETLYKKDGSISIRGEKWFKLLESLNLPSDHTELVKYPSFEEPGNPGSPSQLKDWLFSLGWIPTSFDYKKDEKTGLIRNIPQINNKEINGICNSVKLLFEKEPALENLDSLSKINHRLGLFKGFLRDIDHGTDNLISAEIIGLTNTFRFQHTKLVNLPAINKPFSANIRKSLIALDDDHILCGSDMSQLEDNTKKHYMFPYDPNYVKIISAKGYDAHLNIGVTSKMITQEDSDFYKQYEINKKNPDYIFTNEENERYKKIVPIRKDSKQVNFGATYGAGPPKIVLTSGMPLERAVLLHKGFWDLNWSIKQIAKNCRVKYINGEMWLWNPVSRFFYSLRYEKDRFSTLNQSTGVYCFDSFVREVRSRGIKISGQWHDEILINLLKTDQERVSNILDQSIDKVNQLLKLNIKLGISKDFNRNYGDCH